MKVLNFYALGKVIPEEAIYIGRAMPHLGLSGSLFANPYKITDTCTREDVIEKYRNWLWENLQKGEITVQHLLDMDRKDLVCFCKQPNKEVACHGDVIVQAVAWAKRKKSNGAHSQ